MKVTAGMFSGPFDASIIRGITRLFACMETFPWHLMVDLINSSLACFHPTICMYGDLSMASDGRFD